jgi:4-hydroxy-tetrahydrodipicolinate synthase
VAPAACAALQAAWRAGDLMKMAEWRDRLTPLNAALFAEVNPVPVKYAVSLLGFCEPTLRLPLIEASAQTRAQVEAAMRFAGILN